mmetsp:Transcript_12022/g.18470  ORF Transcript_12022/g.18470 Transcript_12022/m.18470 type:complete len:185 (-) Transcript_12022:311-865(-)|eukprot:CAMPEP_0194582176 /NCGR_PEP_ID=MMETSP0292-20121207/15403_1 /TAXON_ID=39354 /ORGANISM="Heterosigma akashiwo, Strain CCMP2393" /LENGTH=184 /DNA_ID=CAMNT_0039436187 /DNA_START=30 /DNA_END=584 /DNA_ORIENTATION=-
MMNSSAFLVLLLLGTAAAFQPGGWNSRSASTLQASPDATPEERFYGFSKYPVVSPQLAYKKMIEDPHKYQFLDVRDPNKFVTGHAPNSINNPIVLDHEMPRGGKSKNRRFAYQVDLKIGRDAGKIIFVTDYDGQYSDLAVSTLIEAGWDASKLYVVRGGTKAYAKDFRLPLEYAFEYDVGRRMD